MKKRLALSLTLLALAAAAHAASGNEQLLQRHLSSFSANDLEAVVADYTPDAVLVTPDATYAGPDQIRVFFRRLIAQFPVGASTLAIDRTVFDKDLVYFTWHAKTPTLDVPFATDTMIVRDGKIVKQTFGGLLQPAHR